MYIFGDIGNSETKLFLINKKEKILKRINLPTNYINNHNLDKKIKFLTKNINDIEKILPPGLQINFFEPSPIPNFYVVNVANNQIL